MKLIVKPLIHALMSLLLAVSCLLSEPLRAQEGPIVDSAYPSSAIQGTYDLNVEILGSNFGRGAKVRFLANCEGMDEPPPYCDDDAPGVTVGPAKAKGSTKLTVEVDIAEDAYVGEIDIEVELYGRKGKGTTLFKVESSANGVAKGDCNLTFVAEFDDSLSNGLRSDDGQSYPAIGGWGFRLDTNGSQRVEGARDDRKIIMDFDVHDADLDCASADPLNPAVATGFCRAYKGVDLRIEHMIQERPGLCYMDWGTDQDDTNDTIRQAVVVNFLGEVSGELFNPDRKKVAPANLVLDYGCRHFQLDPPQYRPEWRALVTRHSEWEWSIVGEWACLHTQSQPAVLWGFDDDADGIVDRPVPIYMPFGIWITDVNKPAEP